MSRPLRCAIYTRKSSEEGLDQAFNSLEAQREACAAYIESQRHEGWKLLATHYDDGGYSGGTLGRPALQQLLADIAAGKVDLIVIYKVDRLTRSLSDFAKLVEQLDEKNVSFVSVTQAFNTTTSMGRLTLNVLLSFAQFEREVTGERIRDKIAASKKKGMWMGGMVPRGYDVVDRKLIVNQVEAEEVRAIFRRYLELGHVSRLRDALKEEGFQSRIRPTKSGKIYGGCSPSSGALFKILMNPIYRGEIPHRDARYPGQHEAIVPEDLWNAAQDLRKRNTHVASVLLRAQGKHPLLGLLVDEQDRRYQAVATKKKSRRYRYYLAKAVEPDAPPTRYPAGELEDHVTRRLHAFVNEPQRALEAVIDPEDDPSHARRALSRLREWKNQEPVLNVWRQFFQEVRLRTNALSIVLDRELLRTRLGFPSNAHPEISTICLVQPMRLYRTSHELRLVIPSEQPSDEAAKKNEPLIRFLARGRHWYRQITSGELASIQAIAKAEGVTERYVARVLRGSLLAPELMRRILDGRQPVNLTVRRLLDPPPLAWADQLRHFGVGPE